MALRMNAGGALEPLRIGVSVRRGAVGVPLPDDVRRDAEQILGEDLSDVRIHVGPEPRRMRALAFTIGPHVYFAPGLYNPRTREGRTLLGHELAHVVQQRRGRARNSFGYGIAVVRAPILEEEADRIGKLLASNAVQLSGGRPAHPQAPRVAQRASSGAKTSEKDCFARVHYGFSQSINGIVDGKYNTATCEHAEISALSNYIDNLVPLESSAPESIRYSNERVAYYLAQVLAIQITSPPCKVCDQILTAIELRSRAMSYDGEPYAPGVYGRVTGSYGKPHSAALRAYIFSKLGPLNHLYSPGTNSNYNEGSYWQLLKDWQVR